MFKLAVLGPLITSGLGVARQCVECARHQPQQRVMRCYGMGPGCLGYVPVAVPVVASDHKVRLGTK